MMFLLDGDWNYQFISYTQRKEDAALKTQRQSKQSNKCFPQEHVNIFLLRTFRTKNMCNSEKNGLRDSRNGKKKGLICM